MILYFVYFVYFILPFFKKSVHPLILPIATFFKNNYFVSKLSNQRKFSFRSSNANKFSFFHLSFAQFVHPSFAMHHQKLNQVFNCKHCIIVKLIFKLFFRPWRGFCKKTEIYRLLLPKKWGLELNLPSRIAIQNWWKTSLSQIFLFNFLPRPQHAWINFLPYFKKINVFSDY